LSVARSTLAKTGRVERVLTARPTMLNPFARFSCRQETFMIYRLMPPPKCIVVFPHILPDFSIQVSGGGSKGEMEGIKPKVSLTR
jgi:hypothetical protein